jgi:starch synthase
VRVAFAASELAPHAQVGGLADVARWLPAKLAAAGDDVRVFVPHYDVLDPGRLPVVPVDDVGVVPIGPLGSVTVATLGDAAPGRPVVYLVAAPEWFRRGRIYDPGPDEHLRFAALSRAVLAVCDRLGWTPDVIHANDWHTALLPVFAAAAGEPWATLPTMLTVHNLAYQGWFPAADLGRLGLAEVTAELPAADLAAGGVNSLRVGITTASLVTTVSPTYADEIRGPLRGFGLEADLAARGERLIGILNGIGDDWDPATDEWIAHRFAEPAGKAPNTAALRDRFGLEHRADVPVLGIVSRLDRQKGFELLRATLPPLFERRRAQLTVVGTGDPAFEAMFSGFAARHPGWVAYHRGFDTGLAHLVEAGSNMFLMPSEFEPCGLNQMYSMRYGTVPVVHRTGGLADTVEPWEPGTGTGTGFVFDEFTQEAFSAALRAALDAFRDRRGWRMLMANGMAKDFSWEARAAEYRAAYRSVVS